MTVLGIDFGDKYLGVAVGTSSSVITPLKLVNVANWEEAISELAKIANSFKVDHLALGDPTGKSQTVEKFGTLLKSRLRLPLSLVDERYSSVEALAEAVELGTPKEKRSHLDSLAAVIIVRRYFSEPKIVV